MALQLGCLPRRTRAELSRSGEAKQAAELKELCAALGQWRMASFLFLFFSLSFGVGVVERLIFAYVQCAAVPNQRRPSHIGSAATSDPLPHRI